MDGRRNQRHAADHIAEQDWHEEIQDATAQRNSAGQPMIERRNGSRNEDFPRCDAWVSCVTALRRFTPEAEGAVSGHNLPQGDAAVVGRNALRPGRPEPAFLKPMHGSFDEIFVLETTAS
jgi:hypothetical protein